jgi:hypothetical protein
VVTRQEESAGIYYVSEIARLAFGLKGHKGLFVRYKAHYHPVHGKQEFRPLMKTFQEGGFSILMRAKGSRDYNPTRDPPKFFILDWDRPVGRCYDPWWRRGSNPADTEGQ